MITVEGERGVAGWSGGGIASDIRSARRVENE